ncbi:MAG: corrinoid protein [Clostridiales Family XIII bacterium]|nr:corrinoid protein [Clostridiales Family XIII bacterium]
MSIFEDISEAVYDGDEDVVEELVRDGLDDGLSAQDILDRGLLDGMERLGEGFKNNEVFVPELLIAARALNRGTEILKEKLTEEGVEAVGKVVIATVQGDMHDIGKNLVKLMLEGAGFEIVDLGVDVSPSAIVKAVEEHSPDIVALSSLLTTTMNQQGAVVEALKSAGLRDKVAIMVGGAPVTEAFCEQIGADAYSPDASSAAERAKMFIPRT